MGMTQRAWGQKRNAYIIIGNPEEKRSFGRRKPRW